MIRHQLFILLTACLGILTLAQNLQADSPKITSAQIGLGGQCKLGFWVPARISVEGKLPDNLHLEISAPDTDGINVIYSDSAPKVTLTDTGAFLESTVKVGRKNGAVQIRILAGGKELCQRSIPITDCCIPIASLTELYASVGRSIEISSGAKIGTSSSFSKPVAISMEDMQRLPDRWIAYESLDGMILETGLLADSPLSDSVQAALVDWVSNGGRMILMLGANAPEVLNRNPKLSSLIRATPKESQRIRSVSNIELTIKGFSVPDRPVMAYFEDVAGEVLIDGGNLPVFFRSQIGFGHCLVSCLNLAEPPFATVENRKQVTGYLIDQLHFERSKRSRSQVKLSRYGYQDTSGQLRTALDSFKEVWLVNFTVVAFIAIIFILLIGPGDYFFLKRVVKKMEWTWLTFLLIVGLVSFLTIYIFYMTKPQKLICRQVEVVDIDLREGTVRGSTWAHVYSPRSQRYDLKWQFSLSEDIDQHEVISSWQGYPGNALGGMDNKATAAHGDTRYRISIENQTGYISTIQNMPINVAATKGIAMQWTGEAKIEKQQKLAYQRSNLSGRLTNPLEVDLDNVHVYHHRSVYLLKSRLSPGDSFDVKADTLEKGTIDHLRRRRLKELGTEETPWSVTDTSLNRIMEITMFYNQAGGQGYTSLLQRFHNRVDFSDLVGKEHAVLVGRSKTPANRLQINGKVLDEEYEENWTYYRILVPVETGPDSTD